MKASDWINRLKHVCNNRGSYYDNTFPGNCGQLHANGVISFDCIGLVKSVINEPDIVYKTDPVGYYVTPGKVIPDTTEIGILQLCTGVVWGDFSNVTPGEYLYMGGHGGVFVGEYTDSSGVVNTIECTGAMGGGVKSSYCDVRGNRYDHKGGTWLGTWEAHGKLSRYIDYSDARPTPAPAGKLVSALAFDCIKGVWLPIVTSGASPVDTIGNPHNAMGGFAVHASDQVIRYAVHDAEKGWLPPVTGYNVHDFEYGFAGNLKPIDGAIIFGEGIAYQAKVAATQEWLDPVYSDKANYGDFKNGFAGNLDGQIIDEMRIWRV